MQLNSLRNNFGAKKNKIRLGRGIGSGKGKTCGRGHKGQKARSGVAIKSFEGGQMPMKKRLPKRGFNSLNPVKYQIVKLSVIESLLNHGTIDPSSIINKNQLLDVNVIKKIGLPIKILSDIEKLSIPISIKLDSYSCAAKSVIESAGGKVL